MSKSSSSSLNGKSKTPEDANVKILRDLAHIPANRHCFDCGQRGPTYVNVTIGSFVCMTCSGLLRGLTPPHRVKSISMASFTADEIELLKAKGNEYCRKVWLATCTAKDSNIGSEKDPDRVNLLKNFMSAKYEQKRFYVELSISKLNEIQEQTARALSSVSQNLTGSSTSSMQKSPSLSSTRSSNSQQSNPSPVLNNLRNNNQTQQSHNQSNRLVNSITLPDIKPLTSLIGPSVQMTNQIESKIIAGSAGAPNPINFINNLIPNQQQQVSSKINNHNNMLNISPWGASSDTNGVLNGDNNFNGSESNFADFEDAFSRSNLNGSNNDFFAGQNQGPDNQFKNNNGISFPQSHISSGILMQQPLLPQNNSGNHLHHQPVSSDTNSTCNLATNNGCEDKYAALKDLDSLFKQTANGDGNGTAAAHTTGISSSASLPANLSSSSGSAGTAWFSTSPNQNPFSQAPVGQQQANGWNGITGTATHNPFFFNNGGNSWKSTPVSNNTTNSGIFTSGPSHLNFSPVSSSPLQQQQMFPSAISSTLGKPVNPFFTPAANPNNPFL